MLSSHSFLPPRAGALGLTRTTTAPGRNWRPAGAAPRYHLACRAARPDRDGLHDRFVSSCDGLSRPVLLRAGGAGAPQRPGSSGGSPVMAGSVPLLRGV
ncbi:hypothetical protein HMPREF1979_03298 [Actinomyces johnsonii F0542]|uniref:Uncharacterized protein n=1 Tax=Actinomyces johnsonii F0542 TaxID=1321818 RepID=U1RPV7_9ACTO|nr:hypothetical protein HMPREF1979_03298 [Actinomyces johnsonii F0542]